MQTSLGSSRLRSIQYLERQLLACAVEKAALFQWGASPTRQPLQPEAIGAVMEVTKWLATFANIT